MRCRHLMRDRPDAFAVLVVLLLTLDSELPPISLVLNRQPSRVNGVQAMARPRKPFLMNLELVFQIRKMSLGSAKPGNRGQYDGAENLTNVHGRVVGGKHLLKVPLPFGRGQDVIVCLVNLPLIKGRMHRKIPFSTIRQPNHVEGASCSQHGGRSVNHDRIRQIFEFSATNVH